MSEQTTDLTVADSANGLSMSGSGFNWIGLNPKQIQSVAQAMAMSGMFPDITKDSAKAFVKIMAGQEMGIPPFQAMSDISIIQGKAAAGGNIYASKVKSNDKYDYKVKKWDREGCSIEFFQFNLKTKEYESLGVSDFNQDDAKDAGLLSKDNWKKYPRNMYFNRAMTAGVRTYCPDALNGINAYTPEELGANVDEDGHMISMTDHTKREPVKTTVKEEPQEAEVVSLQGDNNNQPVDTETVHETELPVDDQPTETIGESEDATSVEDAVMDLMTDEGTVDLTSLDLNGLILELKHTFKANGFLNQELKLDFVKNNLGKDMPKTKADYIKLIKALRGED